MADAYNHETNILEIKDKYGNHYRLELKGNKNIVKGDSGTGKTYLSDLIESIKKKEIQSDYNVDNIIILNALNVSKLKTFNNKLIIIDRAEFLLDSQAVLYINSDMDNRYLIFSRVPLVLYLSPNHQAAFDMQGDMTFMSYR